MGLRGNGDEASYASDKLVRINEATASRSDERFEGVYCQG